MISRYPSQCFWWPFFSLVDFIALNPPMKNSHLWLNKFQFGARHFAVLRPENPERRVQRPSLDTYYVISKVGERETFYLYVTYAQIYSIIYHIDHIVCFKDEESTNPIRTQA